MTADHDLLPPELLEAVLDALLAVPAAERAAVCDRFAREHPGHAATFAGLLASVAGADRLLAAAFPAGDGELPSAIGPYTVECRLGAGAFGVVYRCRQTTPVNRPVAVKVLRPGMADHGTVRRFLAESHLLAALRHPAIAHVYDAGEASPGRPFFAMEFVEGRSITEHCRIADAPLDERLRLFRLLCRGVGHAHRSGIVHRDLKPANVLVALRDREAELKIIDFGIAKATAAASAVDAAAPATVAGRVLGTPGYMSPEQAAGRGAAVDARADVFALGVLLYELLTGELPWPASAIATDESIELPSRRSARQRAPIVTPARLRGDLDRIVGKALAVDPTARYRDAHDLADDLDRHLAGRPVYAVPPTLMYRLSRLARRHRLALAMTLTAAVAAAVAWGIDRTRSGELAAARAAATTGIAAAEAAARQLLARADGIDLLRTPQNDAVRRVLAADALRFYDELLQQRPDDPVLRRGRVAALRILSQVHCLLGQYAAAVTTALAAEHQAAVLIAAPGVVAADHLGRAAARRLRARAEFLRGDTAAAVACYVEAAAELKAAADIAPIDRGLELARIHRELTPAMAHHGDLAARQQALTIARQVVTDLAALLAAGGDAPERLADLQSELQSAHLAVALRAIDRNELDEASASLDIVATASPALSTADVRVRATFAALRADVAVARRDPERRTLLQQARDQAEQWLSQEPRQWLAHDLVRRIALDQATAADRAGDFAAGDAALQRAVAIATGLADSVADAGLYREALRETLFLGANSLWDRFRRRDLATAATWLELAAALPEPAIRRDQPWPFEIAALRAAVATADGKPAAELWGAAAAALPTAGSLPTPRVQPGVVRAWLGLADHHHRAGDGGAAATAVTRAEALLATEAADRRYRSEAELLRARLALAHGDVAAAAPHVAAVLDLRPTWWGLAAAGDCERRAWQRLATDGADVATRKAAREAAARHLGAAIAALDDDVAAHPTDPWFVAPWVFANLGLAEIEADRGEAATADALARLERALAGYARIEDEVHRDRVDEHQLAAGRELLNRLRTGAR